MHKHHITPRHLGGTDDPDNLVEVTVEEHAEIHRCLWVYGGRWQDRVAWQGLSKQITREKIQQEICRETGKRPKTKEQVEKLMRAHRGRKRPMSTRLKISEAMKGHKGWNKGLTKETDERVRKNGIAISQSYRKE